MKTHVFLCATVIFTAVLLCNVTAMSIQDADKPWRRDGGKLLAKLYNFEVGGSLVFKTKPRNLTSSSSEFLPLSLQEAKT